MAEVGQGEQKEAHNTGEDSFGVKPYWQKMLILFGGILFNLLFAYISLALLFILGAPKTHMLAPLGIVTYKPVIHTVIKDSPAEKASLKPGDEILQVSGSDGKEIRIEGSAEQLTKALRAHPDETVRVTIKRGEHETFHKDITLGSAEISEDGQLKKIGIWGAQLEIDEIPAYSFGQSIAQGIRATNIYILTTIYAFKNMFVKRDIKGVGGPVMIIAETMKGAQKGFKIFLLFLAIISINLAILNLLPLPILDGGQIMFVTLETLIGKQLPKLREYIHIGSWLLMLALIIFLTVRDLGILKLFGIE
jgi:regulator of sigma E protease